MATDTIINQKIVLKIKKTNSIINTAIKTGVTTLFLFLAIHTTYSQGIDDIIISGSYKNRPVIEIMKEMEDSFPVVFHYNYETVRNLKFSGSFTGIPFYALVERLVDNSELTYIIVQNQVFLVPRVEMIAIVGKNPRNEIQDINDQRNVIMVGNPHDAGKYRLCRLSGVVRDGKDKSTLVGTTVEVVNTSMHAVSGINGGYHLELNPGNYTLKVRCLGYETTYIKIRVVGPGKLDIDIFEASHQLSEVSVYARRPDRNVSGNQMSVYELDALDIKKLPLMMGERDIMKSLTMAPGVVSVGEFGSGINVRGGGEDQNLYLIEGAPLFNTSHAMGLLSVLNPDIVTGVSLFKGHIPAQYGERVSSVMEIQMRDRTIKETRVKGGIGIFSSRIQAESPIFHEKITLKLGARASYSDFLLHQIRDYNLINSSMQFYDLAGLMDFHFENNPITIMGYRSRNYFKYIDIFSNQYENTLGSVSWSHLFSPVFASNLKLAYSNYVVERQEISEQLFAHKINSSNEYLSSKISFSYKGFTGQSIDVGGQAILYNISPGVKIPLEGSVDSNFKGEPEQGREFALFTDYVIDLSPGTSFQAGVRLTRFQYMGPKRVYQYIEGQPMLPVYIRDSITYPAGHIITQYDALEPRLSLKQMINDESSVKISYNRNTQFLFLLAYTSVSTPEDTWKLSDPYLKPIRANQFALGYYRNFKQNMFETSVETYYKQLDDIVEYRNGAQLSLNNHVETELLPAKGYNYGVELMVKKNSGALTGIISYTYSRSMRKTLSEDPVDQINRNELYPSSFDKPNDLGINLLYNVNRRMRFGAVFNYSSGRPITLPEYVFNIGPSQLVYFSDRNKYTLPAYHRLDLSISLDENLRRKRSWKGSWTFSVLNVYARSNAYSVFYRYEEPTIHNNYNKFSLQKLSIISKALPTLTYNFIF
jgi:hypothetical protein